MFLLGVSSIFTVRCLAGVGEESCTWMASRSMAPSFVANGMFSSTVTGSTQAVCMVASGDACVDSASFSQCCVTGSSSVPALKP